MWSRTKEIPYFEKKEVAAMFAHALRHADARDSTLSLIDELKRRGIHDFDSLYAKHGS